MLWLLQLGSLFHDFLSEKRAVELGSHARRHVSVLRLDWLLSLDLLLDSFAALSGGLRSITADLVALLEAHRSRAGSQLSESVVRLEYTDELLEYEEEARDDRGEQNSAGCQAPLDVMTLAAFMVPSMATIVVTAASFAVMTSTLAATATAMKAALLLVLISFFVMIPIELSSEVASSMALVNRGLRYVSELNLLLCRLKELLFALRLRFGLGLGLRLRLRITL